MRASVLFPFFESTLHCESSRASATLPAFQRLGCNQILIGCKTDYLILPFLLCLFRHSLILKRAWLAPGLPLTSFGVVRLEAAAVRPCAIANAWIVLSHFTFSPARACCAALAMICNAPAWCFRRPNNQALLLHARQREFLLFPFPAAVRCL